MQNAPAKQQCHKSQTSIPNSYFPKNRFTAKHYPSRYFSVPGGICFPSKPLYEKYSGVCMQPFDSEAVENVYSIVLTEDEIPEIVEGEIEGAIFTGTQEKCQAEILMSLLD
ncbi:hypothetical protein [Scytonema hofmannii]|uniref:hypothetical protein n=1 Tax=Scytonema hofmannii TaxID=34078 RepID=UPI0011E02065|nr:hypothetical protein [Scytonema hofmannii]